MSTTVPGPAPEFLDRMQDAGEALLEATNQTTWLLVDLYAATLEAITAAQRQAADELDIPWLSDVVEAGLEVTEEWARAAAWARRQLS